ncbi:long-chain-fatty-acid--CoA ligase [Spirosoma aerophilum]
MTPQPSLITADSVAIEPLTLPQLLSRSALRFGEQPALVFMGFSISYSTLTDLVNRMAQSLADIGIRPGDRVAIMLPNLPQTVVANYAILRLGAVAVMVNPLYTVPELTDQLNDSGAKTLIVLDALIDKAKAAWPQTSLTQLIVCHVNDLIPVPTEALPANAYRAVETGEGINSYLDLQADYPVGHPFPDQSRWHDTAALLYTGGTTGQSKGVMLTHANISSNVQQAKVDFDGIWLDGRERSLAIYPFFHVAGYTGVQVLGLSYGAVITLIPRPDPDSIINLLRTFKPTSIGAVPTIYVGLLNDSRWAELDLSSLKILITSSAPMAASTYPKLMAKCPQVTISEVWGMTELSGFATGTSVRADSFKPGSIGVPYPNGAVKIVDAATGQTILPLGEHGEICFRGPQVMVGYWNKPDATADVLRDGWLYSGDIGYIDNEGWLFIVDRKKDMIIAGGYNIYPRELDEVLYSHPAILEACCVGIPDAYRGETVKAFIVLKPGETLTADQVSAFCRERLAAYKIPKHIEFLGELPKSVVGKILRRELLRLELLK